MAQAVWVCIPHTAGLVLVDNWDTEVRGHPGKGLENVRMEKGKKKGKKVRLHRESGRKWYKYWVSQLRKAKKYLYHEIRSSIQKHYQGQCFSNPRKHLS